MTMSAHLPSPNQQAEAQTQALQHLICAEINNKGPITFARYMELALYAPQYGYYRSGLQKFGENGDFITAPELSPLFSKCLAKQCQQVLSDLPTKTILELGPGSGKMAADILTELAAQDSLPQKYYLLELSAELRQRQQHYLQQKIPQWFSRLQWLDQLPAEPISGIILANEVVDAMPVHKFAWHEEKLYEYYVDYNTKQFSWLLDSPSDPTLQEYIQSLSIENKQDYSSEINLMLPAWIKSLSDSLQQGLILIIDYGFPQQEYYHPERNQGTLMCHYQHRAHPDPLILPGLQDITAHVDFTAIANAALNNQCEVSGYTSQALFLLNCGLTELLPIQLDIEMSYTIAQQIKRLTLPSEMGELFKVIALTKDYPTNLLGFKEHNRLRDLL